MVEPPAPAGAGPAEALSPLIVHLLELRRRVMVGLVAVFALFCALLPFANELFALFARPLIAQLPAGSHMIATSVAAPFLTPFKLAFVSAVFLAAPVIIHQLWRFVAPGLYASERRLVVPLLVSTVALFYSGIAFAWAVVFPLVFQFFVAAAPPGVVVMTDIASYLDFALAMFFAFGIAFEMPVFAVLLVWAGVATPRRLGEVRPYVLIGCFVVGAILTPPDVISQSLLAVPMYLLYEAGILMARVLVPGARAREAQERAGTG
jgi:sec-independent protein translocase protein TatC